MAIRSRFGRKACSCKGRCHHPRDYSDPDARWGAKSKDYTFFGYKVHLIVDAKSQLPLDVKVTPGEAQRPALGMKVSCYDGKGNSVVDSDTRGITFFGRSDTVLKPSGIRIGTAEIYNQVEKLEEIADSLAIGQEWKGDQRVILFVKLAEGYVLTDELKDKIKKILRENTSPRLLLELLKCQTSLIRST